MPSDARPSQQGKQRAPASDYFPAYVDDDAELDYCYEQCRCGWTSDIVNHPSQARYHGDLHTDYGHTADCSLTKTVLLFDDGTEARI